MVSVIIPVRELKPAIDLLNANGLVIDDLTPNTQLMGMYAADQLIALIGLDSYGELGLLRSLVVDTHYQGKGLAKELVSFIEHTAQQQGIQTLYLLTNTAAKFFARLNYSVVERNKTPETIQATQQFSGLCPDSAIIMMKQLN